MYFLSLGVKGLIRLFGVKHQIHSPSRAWEPMLLDFFFFTDEARVRDCGVLVHCYAGVSRSATVTVAYIMKHLKMPLNEAYQFVKNKRPVISPNLNFMGHLLNYEKNWRNEKWGKPSRGIGVARGLDGAEGTCPCGRLFSAFATLDMRDGGAFCHLGWRHYSGLDFS